MRTRNQSKRPHQSTGKEDAVKPRLKSNTQTFSDSVIDPGSRSSSSSKSLTNVSRDAVGRLLRRVNPHASRDLNQQDSYLCRCDYAHQLESGSKGNEKQVVDTTVTHISLKAESCSRDAQVKDESGNFSDASDESYWEDGCVPTPSSPNKHQEDVVTIEFDVPPDESAKHKPIRRASAEDKELAELVHKAHLLCLLGRGRLIDSACNDPLIQASLLSILPSHLLKIADGPKITANALTPIVNWFHNNFHIRSSSSAERQFHSALSYALETHEGTPEEVAALSVALLRSLNFTTRFVCILDVTSLKPDAVKSESISRDTSRVSRGVFNSSTLMVSRPDQVSVSPVKQSASDDTADNIGETSARSACKIKASKSTRKRIQSKGSPITDQLKDRMLYSLASESENAIPNECETAKSEGSKRKGDLEFEMQLKMALSATGIGCSNSNMGSDKDSPSKFSNVSPFKRVKKFGSEESLTSSHEISTALGSRKEGAPLYWAEVYCSGENLTGKWVHVDAVNAIIDGEQNVEASAAACKNFLRYVVAFAGHGAKDVTRRYCMKWHKIASQRINSIWWDAVLAPLRELESGATGDVINLKQDASNAHVKVEAATLSDLPTRECLLDSGSLPGKLTAGVSEEEKDSECSVRNSFVATRSSLEDMELETRALTEPLPTTQQAYKNHQLYAIERWLTKYQILHPKGPVLGFCSGHPVYPRTCVQTLHTKERWLREGLQVKSNELPAKVLKHPSKLSEVKVSEDDDYDKGNCERTVLLYGKWQTEPLCLPHAVDGIVPKNERGQVDVWSERCLPPGTVHLRLPRVAPVAKRLEIDFAPAMVGFEFRNGRSYPVFDGIVVCAEFEDAILEAYAEEEERREAAERKRNEVQALSRWYQLLSSLVTRQRLNNCYGNGSASQASIDIQKSGDNCPAPIGGSEYDKLSPRCWEKNLEDYKPETLPSLLSENHEHVFLTDDQSFDDGSSTRTKRCCCGFSIQVEEL